MHQRSKHLAEDQNLRVCRNIQEYQARRQRVLAKLAPASIGILQGGKIKFRNQDSEFPFRQSSDFLYLTGFDEPEAALVLLKDTQGKSQSILFCRPSKPEEEVWTGPRVGIENAKNLFAVDEVFDINELENVKARLSENKKICDLLPFIHEMRLIKSQSEIEKMKKAADISVQAHQRLMKYCRPNQMEYQLEAEFLHECYQGGSRALAYTSIVGGGKNACTLHYINNDQRLQAGDLVLVDAGCEYEYYASDITRTYPVNGRFTSEQRALYELVLESQLAAIAAVRPGTSWPKLQEIIVEILVKGLVSLEILKGEVQQLIKDKAYQPFYMHSSGHWIGLDVHDVGGYKTGEEWRTLQPGMVLTVEPGLYIREGAPNVDKKWQGIGIRIEDDVLVTEQGATVLTGALAKTVKEIESLMHAT